MLDVFKALGIIALAGALVVGVPIAGGVFGSLIGTALAVIVVYVLIKTLREEASEERFGNSNDDKTAQGSAANGLGRGNSEPYSGDDLSRRRRKNSDRPS